MRPAIAALPLAALVACSDSAGRSTDSHVPFAGIRNVVLIVVDTLRADHLHCYGYPRRTSDTIDAAASDGVRFDHCYCAWPETCQSMAAILSGLYPQTNGCVLTTPSAVSTEIEMLPETLRRAGWQTAAFVTNPCLAPANHFDQGFEGDYHECLPIASPGTPPREETTAAKQWIRAAARRGPFFAWIHYIEPHAPYEPRKRRRFVTDRWYDPSRKVVVHDEQWNAIGGFPAFSRLANHDELAWYVAQYDSEIVDVDHKLASIFELLVEEELDDSTLVIVTADHGEGLGEHDYYWHGLAPFDETTRVPLIVRAPGLGRGVASDPVSSIDLAPTILDVLGLPIPAAYEGRSLVAQLRDPSAKSDRLLFTESGQASAARGWQRTVRDRDWKLVWMPDAKERAQFGLSTFTLFDLAHDPGETTDRSAEHRDVFERLRGELDAWVRPDSLYHAEATTLDEGTREQIRKQGYATPEGDASEKRPPDK